MLVNVNAIKIKNRIRQDLGDIDALAQSIKTYGLMCPIVINEKDELVAGGRRLSAVKLLGWENIEAKIIDSKSEVQYLEMELEENNQRKSFTQDELLVGYERLEKLRNPSFWRKVKDFFKKIGNWFKNLFHRKKK